MNDADNIDPLTWVLEKTGAAKKPSTPKAAPDLTAKKITEIQMVDDWRKSGFKPAKLNPILQSLKPLIEGHARKYKNRVEIPNSALDFEYKKNVTKALKTWDPDKASLGTWVTRNMQRVDRFVKMNQNFARIPEARAAKIGKFKAVKADITERLGYEPDAYTLADESGLSLKEVKLLTKEIRKGLIVGGEEDIPQMSAINVDAGIDEVKHLIYPELTQQERIVHEYTTGLFGKPVLKTSQIAKRQGWDDSKVSKLKKSIKTKMEKYTGPL